MMSSPFEERMPHVLMDSPESWRGTLPRHECFDTTAPAALPINFGLETAPDWFNLVYAR